MSSLNSFNPIEEEGVPIALRLWLLYQLKISDIQIFSIETQENILYLPHIGWFVDRFKYLQFSIAAKEHLNP